MNLPNYIKSLRILNIRPGTNNFCLTINPTFNIIGMLSKRQHTCFYCIWRRIEVVITDMTRNIVGSVTHHSLKLRCLSAFTPRAFAFSENRISQFSRNLGIRLCLYNFIWRRIEVVITGLTRNQLGSNPPRVRISPSPPRTTVIL